MESRTYNLSFTCDKNFKETNESQYYNNEFLLYLLKNAFPDAGFSGTANEMAKIKIQILTNSNGGNINKTEWEVTANITYRDSSNTTLFKALDHMQTSKNKHEFETKTQVKIKEKKEEKYVIIIKKITLTVQKL